MYVCVCNRVSDKDIKTAVIQGADSLEMLSEQLDVATCCGRCENCARKVLHETTSELAYQSLAAA